MDPIELNDEMNLAPTSAGEPLAAGPGLTFRDCWYFLLFAASLALPNLIYSGGTFFQTLHLMKWVFSLVPVGLLALIGCNMIRESFSGDDESKGADIGFLVMFVLAIATSIDAFAVGISMAMDGEEILLPAVIIGVITFAISVLGVKAGSIFGDRLGSRAELLGGIILILIGIKVVLEHTGFL